MLARTARIDPLHLQEPQKMPPLLAQPLCNASIVGIGDASLFSKQGVQLRFKRLNPDPEGGDLKHELLVPQSQSLLQNLLQLPTKAHSLPPPPTPFSSKAAIFA